VAVEVADVAGELGLRNRYAPPATTASTAITKSTLLLPEGFCSLDNDFGAFELVMVHAGAVFVLAH
jgi:hypothetical protein